MFKINLIECVKNIDKNKFFTYLSVILFTLLFIFQGYTYSYYSINNIQKELISNDTIKNYQLYELGCKGVSPIQLKYLFPENLEIETAEYYEDLDSSKHIKYVGVNSGGILIDDFRGDKETFMEYQREDGSFMVYALYVTPNFHKVENYRVIEGRDFTDEDMVFVEGQPRAVLLGYKYKGVYEVGDILERSVSGTGESSVVPKIEVIGFLEEDTTIMERAGTEIYDLDNYIVYPRYFIPIEEWENYDEVVVKNALNTNYTYAFGEVKILFDKDSESEGLKEWQTAINNYSGFGKYYTILETEYSIKKEQARTEAVTEFAFGLVVVLMASSFITIAFSIINRIENNLKDYAIHISLGASFNGIIGFVISEMAIILGCSMVLGLTVTKLFLAHLYMPYYFLEFLGIFAVTSLLVILLSAITAKLALKKYDLCTLIK